jgi:hypothetical protein
VAQGLSSISFNPDALLRGITLMNEAEASAGLSKRRT